MRIPTRIGEQQLSYRQLVTFYTLAVAYVDAYRDYMDDATAESAAGDALDTAMLARVWRPTDAEVEAMPGRPAFRQCIEMDEHMLVWFHGTNRDGSRRYVGWVPGCGLALLQNVETFTVLVE